MNYSAEESREDAYDVYYAENGDRIVVLEGLDPNDRIELSPLQEYIRAHYTLIESLYWLIFFSCLVFLATRFIVLPLWEKWRAR